MGGTWGPMQHLINRNQLHTSAKNRIAIGQYSIDCKVTQPLLHYTVVEYCTSVWETPVSTRSFVLPMKE